MIIDNPTIEDMRQQVKEHAYCHIRYPPSKAKHLLDMYSMSLLVQLHDALSTPEAKEKLNELVSTSHYGLKKAIDFGMKRIS